MTKHKRQPPKANNHPVLWSEATISDEVFTSDPQENNPGMATIIKVRVFYSEDKRPTEEQIAKAAKDAIRRLFNTKSNT